MTDAPYRDAPDAPGWYFYRIPDMPEIVSWFPRPGHAPPVGAKFYGPLDPAAIASSQDQVTRLAEYIMREIDGEPSRSEGAGDCAIRLLAASAEREAVAREALEAARETFEKLTGVDCTCGTFDPCDHCSQYGDGLNVIDAALAVLRGERSDDARV